MAVTMALTSLLVCSDAQAVQVLRNILQDMGIVVESCGDLRMARARLEDGHYDAVLVDCQNEPAAIELIAQARNTPVNKTVVVIAIVSGLNDVRAIFAKGANFMLYKPISRERAAHSMRAARGLMQSERRIRPRIPVQANTSVAYAGEENVPAALVDLSEDGIAFRSDGKLPPHCKVYFQFSLPGNTSLIRLSGEVMWQDSSGRVGIRFAQVPQTSRRVLNDWLQANLAAAAEVVLPESQAPSSDEDASLRLSAGLGLLSVSAGDRRNLSRRACCLGAEVFRANSRAATRCTLIDISPGGCYIETIETFPTGTVLEIVVRTEDLKLRVHGKVLSTHPGFGMGVEFSLRTDEHRKQVQQLIASAQSEPKLL
ncbi:MAG TPA: response regulator [Terriglobales bacterium]|nr:response regulator [Terriglobales bacterium]